LNRRVYFFDLDGTLIDPSLGLKGCTRHALEALGRACPADEVLTSFIGPPLRQMFAALLESDDSTLVEEAVGLFRQRYRERFLVETRLYEDVPVMLQHARSGAAAMFIMTSKPATFAERILDHFAIAPYFDQVYGNGLDGRFDNKADLIGHALAAEGIPSRDALMIGDRAVDVLAANAHGIPTIGVLWGYGSRDELREAGAARLCGTPRELAEYLSPAPPRETVRE
jgi:phosphoglycolate phosphatase